MINELTTQQQSLIPITRDKWIKKLNKPEPFDKEKAKKAVEWLYQFSGLSKPEVLIFDSPLGVQLGLNALQSVTDSVWDSVRDSVTDSVWDSVTDSVWVSVRDSVWDSVTDSVDDSVWVSVSDSVRVSVWDSVWVSVRDSVWDSVTDSVWVSVRDSVWDSVRVSVWDSVWVSVRDSVWDSVRASVETRYYSSCMDGDVSDSAWTSFYDYFREIGLINNDNFNQWLEYCDAGIFYSVQLDGLCAICPMPKYIKRNNDQLMHCEDGYAIEWADGYGIYVLDGIRFDRAGQDELYWKIVRHELTLQEIVSIEDTDHRAVALKYCNAAQDIIKSLEDKGKFGLRYD